jgi:exopolysaccharide biosynthesis polyprenyl glycosylphosphotransferase
MAQIPDFVRNQRSFTRWASASLTDVRVAGRDWRVRHRVARNAAELTRARKSGLGLGERKLLQGVSDWIVVAGGSLLILTQSERGYEAGAMALSLMVVTLLWFFFADAFNAYRVPVMQNSFRSAYTAGKVLVVTVAAYVLVAWFAGGFLPVIRPRISETLAAALIVLPLLLVRTMVSHILARAPLRRKVVVIGANKDGYEMVDALTQFDGQSYEFLGYFDDEDIVATPPTINGRRNLSHNGTPHVLPTGDLLALNDRTRIDQVVLANPMQTGPLLHTLSVLHERGAQITPMFALYQDLTGRVPVSHLGDNCYVALPANVKSTARTYQVVKRGLDIVLAFLVLVVTSPLIPIIALAIKQSSPGPVFYKQMRVGRGGKTFKIIKFRSMRQDAEVGTGAVWAQNGDSRITPIGRFLRKSRLDEIPQLWNVFVGDMSFVGPRPERPEFDEELEREIPFYRARRAVRPGLTGWAQVNYGYGSTMLDALRKVEYDLYYIKNESLYLDLLILLRTVAVVLKLGGR